MKTSSHSHPWRVGAPSYVLPAGVEENVAFLAPLVDDVQLLFFESAAQSALPHGFDIRLLEDIGAEHDLTYTVHLPGDLEPGSDSEILRRQGVEEIARIMEMMQPLAPLCYDLHLPGPGSGDRQRWLDNLGGFLALLTARLAGDEKRIGVENIDCDFDPVRSLALEHGLKLCLDFGHALRFGPEPASLLADIPDALHIHLHGLDRGKDHRPLGDNETGLVQELAKTMERTSYSGPVTLEVYERRGLETSLARLARLW